MELLVAAFTSIIVIGVTGFGLIQMLNASGTNSDETETRAEVNRALDFISDEVRNAKTVWATADNLTVPSGGTLVFRLEMPDINGNGNDTDDEIIYYTKNKSPSDGLVWLGPQMLFRKGPAFDANGNYTTGITSSVLIDRLEELNTPTCSTGTLYPTPSGGKVPGFYVCLGNGNTTDGWDTAHLFFNGQYDSDGTETYLADSRVSARLNDNISVAAVVPDTSLPTSGTTSNCSVVNNALNCGSKTIITARSLGTSYTCKSGTSWSIDTTVKVGTADSNGNIGSPTTSFSVSEGATSNPVSLPANESIQVESDPFLSDPNDPESECNSSTATVDSTNSAQVEILDISNRTFSNLDGFDEDGDPTTPNQNSILKVLEDAGLVLKTSNIGSNKDFQIVTESGVEVVQVKDDTGTFVTDPAYSIDPTDGYILYDNGTTTEFALNLDSDQQFFLYMFEMGHSSPGASANGFDQNDNIILVTAEQAAS